MEFYNELQRRSANSSSDIHQHLPTLFEYGKTAERIIELGVRDGDSTTAFMAGIEIGGGELWSCDTVAPKFLKQYQETCDRWTFELGDDVERAPYAPNKVDVVFIDTSHAYEHTKAELEVYGSKVKPGGVILLHDTELKSPADAPGTDPDFPVRVAAEEYANAKKWKLDLVTGCYGLGIIHVPAKRTRKKAAAK